MDEYHFRWTKKRKSFSLRSYGFFSKSKFQIKKLIIYVCFWLQEILKIASDPWFYLQIRNGLIWITFYTKYIKNPYYYYPRNIKWSMRRSSCRDWWIFGIKKWKSYTGQKHPEIMNIGGAEKGSKKRFGYLV